MLSLLSNEMLAEESGVWLVFGMNSVEHFHTAICVIALVGMLTEVSLQHHLFFLPSNEKVCGLALQHYFLSLFSERLVTDVSTHLVLGEIGHWCIYTLHHIQPFPQGGGHWSTVYNTVFSLCLEGGGHWSFAVILSSALSSKGEVIGASL